MSRSRALVGLALASLSCSAVVDTGRHTTGQPLETTDFCVEYAETTCEANARCCEMPLDPTSCRTALLSNCSMSQGLLDDPRTGYDPAAAAVYLTRAKALVEDCDPAVAGLLEARRFLDGVLAGTRSGGETCTPDTLLPLDTGALLSCERGLVCNFGIPDWTCGPTGPEGTECRDSSGCQIPLICVGTTATMAGTCQPPLANGSSCATDDQCASLRCNPASGTCEEHTVESVFCGADG